LNQNFGILLVEIENDDDDEIDEMNQQPKIILTIKQLKFLELLT